MENSDPATPPAKKVLIVAYYWPPAGGPGVQRWLKFTKYLSACGWEPTLLVPDGAAYPVIDSSLDEDVPSGTVVHRVPIFEPYEAIMRLFQGGKDAERLGSVSSSNGAGWKQFIMMWVRGNLLLPDPRILWKRKAVRTAERLIKAAASEGSPFDALVTTGPPHSIHLIGLTLKRRTGIPWLADFRDLWREMDYLEDFHPTRRTRKRHEQLEQSVVECADRITYTSPSVLRSLTMNAEGGHEKFVLIYNGWDPDDVTQPSTAAPEESQGPLESDFHIGHFGSLFPTRDAPALWQSIREWNQSATGGKRRIHLDIVGNASPPVRASLEQHLEPSDWTDHGYLSHKEAVNMMEQMDALLMIQNNNDTGRKAIPGKAFEYLATGRPMAIVAPMPSDLGTLAIEWGLQPCGHEDRDASRKMLGNLLDHEGSKAELRERYSRPALTHQMSLVLGEMVHPSQS